MKRENFSSKRTAIYNVLKNTTEHPSAKTIYEKLKNDYPDLSLGTVYRNISHFKEKGMVISVATVNGEERIDANTSPHAHFICNGCGNVYDVFDSQLNETAVSLEKQGFKIADFSVNFHGLCYKCNE